jgi:hypothetical protein
MPIAEDVYKKIVGAKVFIDEHFDAPIDLEAIAGRGLYIPVSFSPAFPAHLSANAASIPDF